jgi:glycerol-3-phosphate dehydrogenase
VTAKVVVNAAGNSVKKVRDQINGTTSKDSIRHIKGSHIVVPRVHPEDHAYILQNSDNRIVFVIPYLDRYSLIGTTDVPVDQYEAPHISDDEVDYLLELANAYLAKPLQRSDVVWTYSGVRPLYDDGSSDPSAITRDYEFECDGVPGQPVLLSVYGGKITTYRKLAEAALAELAPWLPPMKRAWTAGPALPGGDLPGTNRAAFLASLIARYPAIPGEVLRPLARRHGSNVPRVLGDAKRVADLGEPFGAGLYAREIDYLVDHEWAREPEDVLWRRTKCGLPMTPAERERASAYVTARAARS